MGWDPAVVPDPQDPATFERSKLDWSELGTGRHARMLDVYRELARLRRALPELTDPAFARTVVHVDEDARLFTMRRGALAGRSTSATPRRASSCGEVAALRDRVEVVLDGAVVRLPAHAGALVRPG